MTHGAGWSGRYPAAGGTAQGGVSNPDAGYAGTLGV